MEKNWNPPLNVGDIVVCYHMEGETGVPPGTKGKVIRVGNDPFEESGKLYEIKWNNGSSLSLVSVTDAWKRVSSESKLNEQSSKTGHPEYDFFSNNRFLFTMFDWKFLRSYLKDVRDSGIVNMFESSSLLYSGPEYIERYYGENPPNQEAFDEVISKSQKAKDLMVQGTIKYVESEGKEVDLDIVNGYIRNIAKQMVLLYITYYKYN
jgi:hypothetical protein